MRMKNRIISSSTGKILLVILFLITSSTHAQFLSESNPKYRHTLAIMQRISKQMDAYRPLPDLKMSSEPLIAEYDPGTKEIIIGEATYDLCQEFGNDADQALACLVGHELAHYHQNHHGYSGFNSLIDKSQGNSYSKFIEAEADQLGLKHAFLAGYPAYRVFPQLIEKIYDKYAVGSNSHYPDKNARIALANEQIQLLQPQTAVFTSANFLLITGFEQEASYLFNYLLKNDFSSQEIFNNLGVTYLSKALATRVTNDNNAHLYIYPFEIDPAYRFNQMRKHRNVNIHPNDPDLKAISNFARKMFERAIELNPLYVPAYINLATTELNLKNPAGAHQYLDQLKVVLGKENQELPGNYFLLKALICAQQKDYTWAERYFLTAMDMNARLAGRNYNIFQKIRGYQAEDLSSMFDEKLDRVKDFFLGDQKLLSASLQLHLPLRKFQNLNSASHAKVKFNTDQNPFIISFETGTNKLPATIIEFKDKQFNILEISGQVMHDFPFHEGEELAKIVSRFGTPTKIIESTGSQVYALYWDKEKSATGLILHIKHERLSSLQFFRLID